MRAWSHLKTINRHRRIVRQLCFKVGLYRQGLTHDLSKYSPTEFRVGMQYFRGNRSPNAAEREAKGYSEAWMHHKGRNRHHYEYWTDLNQESKTYEAVPMPPKFLAEMVMDRIAACKVYRGAAYDDGAALDYFEHAHESVLMHPDTQRKLLYILRLLKAEGEQKTLQFVKEYVIPDKPYPPMEEWL